MRRRLLLAAASLGLLALPAPALAGWSAPETLTRSGQAYGVSVSADVQGDAGVAYVRTLSGHNRAELRRGTIRGRLAAPVVLDDSTRAMDTTALAFGADRDAYVAWRRYFEGNHRVWGAAVDRRAVARPLSRVTGGGESAYAPGFAIGAGGPVLFWGRRTSAAAALPVNGGFEHLPSLKGPSVALAMTTTGGGGVMAAWEQEGGAYAAQLRGPGRSWSAPQRLSDPAAGRVASTPALTVGRDGTVLVAWTTSSAQGIALDLAVRPAGGAAFGAPAQVVDPAERAREPRLAASSSGEVLLAYLATAGAVRSGPVKLVRLTPRGAVAGRTTLTPAGETASEPSLAADGTSGSFAAWTENGPDRGRLRVVRVAPGGIVGTVTTIAGTGDALAPPALFGLPLGGALLAWSSPKDGRVRLARYSL